MDLEKAALEREAYDLVLVFYYLDGRLFPALLESLKPGALLLYKTFIVEQRRFGSGPSHPDHLLEASELPQLCPSMLILHYRETVLDQATAELVGQKT